MKREKRASRGEGVKGNRDEVLCDTIIIRIREEKEEEVVKHDKIEQRMKDLYGQRTGKRLSKGGWE